MYIMITLKIKSANDNKQNNGSDIYINTTIIKDFVSGDHQSSRWTGIFVQIFHLFQSTTLFFFQAGYE